MKKLLPFVLLAGCSAAPEAPEKPTPSERCHDLFDAMCEHGERCDGSDPQICQDFFAGKVPMLFSQSGKGIDVRSVCDDVNFTNGNEQKCADQLREPGCEWPPVCDNVVMGRNP